MKKLISFSQKLCKLCYVSVDSIREHIPGNEVKSLQNASCYMQNSFFVVIF